MNSWKTFHIVPLCILLIIAGTFVPLVTCAPEIQFSFGRIQGFDLSAQSTSKPYYAYYGIPFAQPPTGSLRFRPPVPFQNNDQNRVISSNNYRSSCIQSPGYVPDMSEDCLHLNIFVPTSASRDQPKKVMVYIHGGGFVLGDAKEGRSSRLVTDYDVIVVTIQYRLGVLGFLSTGDDVAPGNNGFRDQLLALRWVKDHISRFGGQADDVTIFGESAGSGSVSVLSLYPPAKGLFTKAIMQSGTLLAPWSNIRTYQQLTYAKAKSVGCLPKVYFPNEEYFHKTMVNCLRSKPIEKINNAPTFVRSGDDVKLDLDLSHYVDFGPIIDGDIIPKNPFALMQDKDYLEKSGALNRSYIIGFTNNEGLSMIQPLVFPVPGATWRNLTQADNLATYLQTSAESFVYHPLSQEMLDIINFVYTYPRLDNGDIPLQGVLDIAADLNFVVPSVVFAKAILEASPKTDIYMYLFDHYPTLKSPSTPFIGSTHALDLVYSFDNQTDWEILAFYADIYTQEDAPLFDVFRRTLTSFARNGGPPQAGLNSPTWPRYDLENQTYMALSVTPEVRQRIYDRRVSLWTQFLPKLVKDGFKPGTKVFTV